MSLTRPAGSCDVIGCLKTATAPEYDYCEEHKSDHTEEAEQ